MANDRIAPLGDLAFKKVLSSNTNKDILTGLIHDFFGFTPKKVTIKKPYTIESYTLEYEKGLAKNGLRYTERDIAAYLETADFIAEAQINKEIFFEKRASYYAFMDYCDNYGELRGDIGDHSKYEGLCPVYSLNILQNNYYKDEHPFRVFRLCDQERGIVPEENPVYIAFFELKKDNEISKEMGFWRHYFLTGEASDGAPAYIAKAAEVIHIANLGRKEREMISRQERNEEYTKSVIMRVRLDAKNEGLAIAEKRAEALRKKEKARQKKEKEESARKMKDKGYPLSDIREFTGLSAAKIQDL
ncbi:MAG: Rpn family recombination-promoting nuclease/putative transposase [Clostridiales Family XIII bacterium]|jgi:predicted transposase/invertase (TIGR01784 family)|nr:Rpn family recombination-promoting nuclease/putative transposase [Clostridiales Family XIII bacterium]